MPLVVIAPAFVASAMYVRRHFGGGPLAALWAVTSAVMALTTSANFMEAAGRMSSVSGAGRALATAFMLFFMAASFGASALAIHRRHMDKGSWLTVRGFVVGVLWFAVGGAIAYAVAILTIILFVARMAP